MTSSPGLLGWSRLQARSVTDDDDRHQRALLVWPPPVITNIHCWFQTSDWWNNKLSCDVWLPGGGGSGRTDEDRWWFKVLRTCVQYSWVAGWVRTSRPTASGSFITGQMLHTYYYYYYKICIVHKFKHARVGGAAVEFCLKNVEISGVVQKAEESLGPNRVRENCLLYTSHLGT